MEAKEIIRQWRADNDALAQRDEEERLRKLDEERAIHKKAEEEQLDLFIKGTERIYSYTSLSGYGVSVDIPANIYRYPDGKKLDQLIYPGVRKQMKDWGFEIFLEKYAENQSEFRVAITRKLRWKEYWRSKLGLK